MIKIDKNKPVPVRHGNAITEAVSKMKVGDSFAIPEPEDPTKIAGKRSYLISAAKSFARHKKLNWSFTTRHAEKEIRIWRVR